MCIIAYKFLSSILRLCKSLKKDILDHASFPFLRLPGSSRSMAFQRMRLRCGMWITQMLTSTIVNRICTKSTKRNNLNINNNKLGKRQLQSSQNVQYKNTGPLYIVLQNTWKEVVVGFCKLGRVAGDTQASPLLTILLLCFYSHLVLFNMGMSEHWEDLWDAQRENELDQV